ncbi:hypothetical protein NLU13_7328 [Sarocladium strictum]|uniref:Uncharacterized protein n=1 Tax=Sarocladium strictum TaxID=5046 RepID=A0AA39GCK7_SARSR|nr:hypothetical protein NLU13_7328 [Sarocladium strictum]
MAATSSDYELLTEHFSYPPVSLLDDIINTVNVLADRALDSIERLLLSIPPQNLGFSSPEAAKIEIESGTHQLETLLNAAIDKNFDLFELYAMRNILTVKEEDQPFMRLGHYEGLDFEKLRREDGEGPQGEKEEESVNALRRRVHASQTLHVALEKERASNDVLLRELRRALGVKDPGSASVKAEEDPDAQQPSPFGFLQNKGSLEEGGTVNPIATTTEFTLSQLQALRALSTSLRTILPDLEAPVTATDEGESSSSRSWRRERVQYVEGASRKYLESHGGLDLGEQGEVRDGEWRGEGREVAREEVEGLERVVTILGSSGKGEQGDSVTDNAS